MKTYYRVTVKSNTCLKQLHEFIVLADDDPEMAKADALTVASTDMNTKPWNCEIVAIKRTNARILKNAIMIKNCQGWGWYLRKVG